MLGNVFQSRHVLGMHRLQSGKRRALVGGATAVPLRLGLVGSKVGSNTRSVPGSPGERSARRAEAVVPGTESFAAEATVGEPIKVHEISWDGALQCTNSVVVKVLPSQRSQVSVATSRGAVLRAPLHRATPTGRSD